MGRSVCSIDECGRVTVARGLCKKHYERWQRHGDPLFVRFNKAKSGAPQEFIEIALNHQDKEGCLYWPFARNGNGYAIKERTTNESQLVSRIICEKVHGPPPSTKHESCHNCGKGNLGCINPHHLRWDTRTGNQAERVIHGTDNRGERHGRSKLSWEQVREIRKMQGILSGDKVAAKFNVKPTIIYNIWQGRKWKE
jgi:hypothetical protein